MKSAKFKDSPLGPIPQDWDVKRLGEIAPLQRGFDLPTKDLQDGPFPVVYSNGICNYHVEAMCDAPGLVTGRSGTIGHFTFIESGRYWPHNTALWVTSFKGNDPLYIKYLYETLHFENFATGSGVPTLNRNAIHEFEVALPSKIGEQQRIAEALGEVDKLIESLDEQIEKKRLIAKGVAHDLLSGKKRLPGFKGAWKTRSIEDMLTLGHGRDYKGIPNGDVPVYGTGGVMCYVAEYLYEGPTVCIGRKGTIDAPIYHDGKIWTVDTLFYSHSFKECYPKFIYYKFLTIDWQSYNEASGVPSLTADIIGRISLEVPMNIAEQQAIADLLSEQDAAITALVEKREKYVRIKEGMMRDLLTGKVRMKGE